MSEKQKDLNDIDLTKLDNFIQNSLDKYIYVKAWNELYENTGINHKKIISDKSTIPDLVIFNKTFNKLDCFYYPNLKKNNKKINFPRKFFTLRPKINKNYIPPLSNQNSEIKKKEEKNFFEFKSIPEEKERKNKGNNKQEENKVIDELNDFMKSENGDGNNIKVELIKDNGKYNKKNNTKYYNKELNNNKNKFSNPYFNSYEDYKLQMIKNSHFNNNLIINNDMMLKNQEIKTTLDNEQNKNIKDENNIEEKTDEKYKSIFDKELIYLEDFENFVRNNMNERIWFILDEKKGIVNLYNNEELYYYLNTILKKAEYKNYSIKSSKFFDVFISQEFIFNILKKVFQKE